MHLYQKLHRRIREKTLNKSINVAYGWTAKASLSLPIIEALSEPMNNKQWNESKNALEMLVALKGSSEERFLQKRNCLQRFYIKCCRNKLYLLNDPEFSKGLDIAGKYIRNRSSRKQVSDQNWKTEGAVFNIDYNCDPRNVSQCLKRIRICKKLSHKESRDYAISLGYFIDWSMLYATNFNGRIPKQYSLFLLASILRQEIHDPFQRKIT